MCHWNKAQPIIGDPQVLSDGDGEQKHIGSTFVLYKIYRYTYCFTDSNTSSFFNNNDEER